MQLRATGFGFSRCVFIRRSLRGVFRTARNRGGKSRHWRGFLRPSNPFDSKQRKKEATGFGFSRCVFIRRSLRGVFRTARNRGGESLHRRDFLRPSNPFEQLDQRKREALSLSFSLVGATGFEPTAFWSRTKRATKLRYAPNMEPMKGLEPLTRALRMRCSTN